MKPSKTRITHTLDMGLEKPGFDFLGFHIQQYPAGKTTSGKDCRGRLHGFKTSITPSPTAIQRHVDALRKTVARHTHAEQERLMQALNPPIRGWSQYYAPVRSARLFQKLDHSVLPMSRRETRFSIAYSHPY
ncbi:MAG TPA: group II intron maturase-specific domain-containing protein [Candidatus Tectomicrobia bacterium]